MRIRDALTPTMLGVVIGAIALGGTAVAAERSVKLGRGNQSSAMTTITNSNGTALKLGSPGGSPALAVSNSAQVPNLNASLLGGNPASAFVKAGTIRQGHVAYVIEPVTDFGGEAICPGKTVPTGGGGLPDPSTATSYLPTLVASTFAIDDLTGEVDGWTVFFDGDSTYDGTGYVTVTCTDLPVAGGVAAKAGQLRHPLQQLVGR